MRTARLRLLATAAVFAGAAALAGPPAFAIDDVFFELDGNAKREAVQAGNDPDIPLVIPTCNIIPPGGEGPGPLMCDDWENMLAPAPAGLNALSVAPNDVNYVARTGFLDDTGPIAGLPGLLDDPQGQTLFYGGSTDLQDITDWSCRDQNAPPKNLMLHAAALGEVVQRSAIDPDTPGVGMDIVANIMADRFANNGNANWSFWFLKDPNFQEDCTISEGFIGEHVIGDILVQFSFTNGGAIGTATVFKYVGAGGSEGSLDLVFSSDPGDPMTPAADCRDASIKDQARIVFGNPALEDEALVCGIVNQVVETAPWPYLGKGDVQDFLVSAFFEAKVNLSQLLAIGGGNEPVCFSNFMAATRASQSFSAELKDFVSGSFPLCGGLRIEKKTIGGVGNFEFESDLLENSGGAGVPDANGDFDLTTVAENVIVGTDFLELPAGPYNVDEVIPSGWALTNISCTPSQTTDIADLPVFGDGSTTKKGADIMLGVTGDVTCTFTNTKLGAIKLVKKSTGAGAQFDFSSAVSQGGAAIPGLATTLTTDPGVNKTAMDTSSLLIPGTTYQIFETPETGWDLTAKECKLADGTTATGTASGNGFINVEVKPGQTTTCTFTNVQQGAIKLVKTSSGNGGTFDFSSAVSQGGAAIPGLLTTLTTDPGANKTAMDTSALIPAAATYQVAEIPETGWELTAKACKLADGTTATGTASGDGFINVEVKPGETTTCTFTNEQASLQIKKTIVNSCLASDLGMFTLDSDASGFTGATVGHLGETTQQSVPLGTHDVNETVNANYVSSVNCTGAASTSNDNGTDIDVTLNAGGQNAVCTFTNVRKPTLTINKVLTQGSLAKFDLRVNGDVAKDAAITNATWLSGNGEQVGNGGTATVRVDTAYSSGTNTFGSVTVSETNFGGSPVDSTAFATFIDCDDVADTAPVIGGTNITIGSFEAGENVTCTITNVPLASASCGQ